MIAGSNAARRNARLPGLSPVSQIPAAKPARGIRAGVALVHQARLQNKRERPQNFHAPWRWRHSAQAPMARLHQPVSRMSGDKRRAIAQNCSEVPAMRTAHQATRAPRSRTAAQPSPASAHHAPSSAGKRAAHSLRPKARKLSAVAQ